MEKDTRNFLQTADESGYAVPAFNYSDIWELEAILEAAEEEHAIVYTASNMRVAASIGLPYLGALGQAAYEQSGGKVLNHLDHSRSVELCKQAVDCGYHSVMIDASDCSLSENIKRTQEVVKYAHRQSVLVEAEIGRILGRNDESGSGDGDYLVQVEDAVKLAGESGVDSLAIGIGTAHGFYKETPKLNLQRLKEVNAALSVPLVLHGGTGIPAETVCTCIENGMAKVNVGTLLHATYVEELRKQMARYSGANISDLMEPVRAAIREQVKLWIHICHAENRR